MDKGVTATLKKYYLLNLFEEAVKATVYDSEMT